MEAEERLKSSGSLSPSSISSSGMGDTVEGLSFDCLQRAELDIDLIEKTYSEAVCTIFLYVLDTNDHGSMGAVPLIGV